MTGKPAQRSMGRGKFSLARLRVLWRSARDSLWFLPGVLTLLGASLAVLGIWLDQRWLRYQLGGMWFFGGGAEGARGVLSAIAGGLITVTGVVFSVTIVALQLASTQFTPRVLRDFTADRANQLVLGVFIGTFTYTLLVLRSVTATAGGEDAFVPAFAVGVAMVLVLVSIGFLIFFIHHAARSIQASFIVNRVTKQSLAILETHQLERPGATAAASGGEGEGVPVHADTGGYIQSVDEQALLRLVEEQGLSLRLERRIGEHVMTGEPIAQVWRAAAGDEVAAAVRRAVVVGFERMPERDVEFGIVELSDIAVKALSPGINDPTTALHCIDRLGEIMARWGRGDGRGESVFGTVTGGTLVLPVTSFERGLGLAFDQVTHFGSTNPVIVRRLADVLARVRRLVREDNRAAIDAQLDGLHAATGGASGERRRK